MTDTATNNLSPVVKRGNAWLLSGVFLTSFALLAVEIALTRVLSVLLSYHFVFAVLSVALMGQGVGALYLGVRVRPPGDSVACLAALSRRGLLCSFSIAVSAILLVFLGQIAPFAPVYLAIAIVPFFVGGLFFAEVFRSFSSHSAWVYGADLTGAAAGSLGVLGLLQVLSAPQTLFAIALVALTAAVVLAFGLRFNRPVGSLPTDLRDAPWPQLTAAAVFLILLFALSFQVRPLRAVAVGGNPEKEIFDALRQGTVERTVWGAYGQTDVVGYADNPDRKDMYIDGTAGTPMIRFNGDIHAPNRAVADLLDTFPGYFPLRFLNAEEKDSALIIGPGGGRDVLLTLAAGFRTIAAVEVNPDLVDLVVETADYNGGIYSRMENVTVTIGEGRSSLKRLDKTYDLIMLSLPATNTSRSREGFALTENFLLTVDAIDDYLEHLTPEGRLLVVTHGEVEALRLLIVALTALNRQGVGTPAAMEQIVLLGDPDYPVFELHKRSIPSMRITEMMPALQQIGYDPAGSFFPHVDYPGAVNPALATLAQGRRPLAAVIGWAKGQGFDISPVDDNRPFFFKFQHGVPKMVKRILLGGVVFLLIIVAWLYQCCIRRQRLLTGPVETRRSSPAWGRWVGLVALFIALGAGFMIVEIAFAQYCFLFIGHPILSIASILFTLLCTAGAGAWTSRRLSATTLHRSIARHLLVVALLLVGLLLLMPALFELFLGYALPIRLIVTWICLGSLGFAMGFPFPMALRLLDHLGAGHMIPWMLGLNGVSAVIGSCLCIATTSMQGTMQALWLAAALYFCCGLVVKVTALNPYPTQIGHKD